MDEINLFNPMIMGKIELENHIVMAPMTRCRAINNIPNDLMAEYYSQRAGAGLIITEGTAPSPNGLGYARIPGIYSDEQVEAWKKVTSAVHEKGGRIFVQLLHTGRIAHPLNIPEGGEIIAPSAVLAAGQIWTDAQGQQDHAMPKEMTSADIEKTKNEFVQASINAIKAGFDGVELHNANGYLLEQFLNPNTNLRTDNYGGSVENRCRFTLEVAEAVVQAIGKDKVGIRISPYGVNSDMHPYDSIDETYIHLTKGLNKLKIVYIHLADHSSMGAPEVPFNIKEKIREIFDNTMIMCGGFDKESAADVIENNIADLVAFGRPYINNPDLAYRMENNLPLSDNLDFHTFYTADGKGYTDYPFASE